MPPKPNIYIGLVCAAGTDLTEIKQQLTAQLAVVGYTCCDIKVSKAIADALDIPDEPDEYERTKQLMNGGDEIRELSEKGSGVASLIVTALRASKGDDQKDNSVAYVIDSLKNPKELEILDQLYGRNFYAISIYSSQDERMDFLANKIARSQRKPIESCHFDLARDLILRDQKGKLSTGQGVRDTFPKGDLFLDARDVEKSIKRFIRLIFQDPFITPTLDEYMMFVAKATALRSCDLSRQVGAVISGKNGEIITTGCNEVPYPSGGFFSEGANEGIGDNRDKVEKHDPNFNEVKKSISQLLNILKDAEILSLEASPELLADELLHGQHKDLMDDARVRNLIEFSRVVHAEMHAITQASLLGRSVAGATMYCTTYPCHLCARHIISAGIADVVYIEPYPKSLTDTLYHREIVSEHGSGDTSGNDSRVVFRTFRGVSPTLYQRVFAYRKRKDDYGAIAKWQPDQMIPVGSIMNAARPDFELFIANQIAPIMEKIHTKRTEGKLDNPVKKGDGGDARIGAEIADST